MKNIDDYVDRLIKDKGFEDKDPEIIAQIKDDLLRSIEGHINAMVISNIPEDSLAEFEKILDTNDQEKITSYIHTKIPDINEKTATVLLSFKNSYLA